MGKAARGGRQDRLSGPLAGDRQNRQARVDRGEWGMSPPTVNAYYNPSMNDISFPAGILQPPLYDNNATDAENCGHMAASWDTN